MDRITSSLLSEFASEYGLIGFSEPEQFEHFVNFIILSREYSESFDLSDIHVGQAGAPGIDGLAIIVNGALVTEEEEVDNLMEANNYLDVNYVFTQAKTSSSFDGSDIGSFIEAVRDFFREEPRLRRSADVEQKAKISDYILKHTSKMRTNPTCALFYATTGNWTGDKNLQARLDQGKEDLEKTALFSRVIVEALGAPELQRLYRQSKETLTIEIEFPNRITLPEIPGIEQAFIGTMPVSVYLRLITDEVGNIRKSVFEENIRDFQGDTQVNDGIRKTLRTRDSNTFVMLNNGITIVCRGLRVTGNRFILSGYQIVNGCQTSHVLYECRNDFEPSSVFLPVKLISTQDEKIVGNIIRATNSQNAVKPEELEAMTEFQKQLETYYRTYSGSGELYYERRSKQWLSSKVEKTRVVTIPNQIKAVSAMFLDLPHRVAGYYGTVRNRIGDQLFKTDHRYVAYYTSALALYRLETLFRARIINPQYRALRWYLLMLLRYHLAGKDVPPLNSKKMDEYCKPIIDFQHDPDKVAQAFTEIILKIEHHGIPEINKDSLKTQTFRDKLIEPFLTNNK